MENSREFFDPMVGNFKSSLNSASDFFTSKLRWRNDAELAEFAWRQPFPQLNQPVTVNMLLTEQSRPEWNPHRRDASPLRSIAACNTSDEAQSSQQSDDLSLMDCEAIDVYWRHDIEQEKGFMIPSMLAPGTSPVDTATEQFERDLQLLTEKSLLAPLSSEENQLYENLAKAQYTDFYNTVAQPYVAPKQNGYSRVLTDISYNRPSSSHATGTSQKQFGFSATYPSIKTEEPEALNFTSFSNQTVLFNNVSLSEARQPDSRLNVSDLLSPLGQPSPHFDSEDLDSLLNVPVPRLFSDDSDWNEFFHSPQIVADINASLSDSEMKPSSSHDSRSQRDSLSSIESTSYGHDEATRDFHNPTPSSGFGSIDSYPTSPHHFDMSRYVSPTDFSVYPSSPPTSRFHGKLAPSRTVNRNGEDNSLLNTLMAEAGILDEIDSEDEFDESEEGYEHDSHATPGSGMNQPRRRGRQSKDDQLVAQHGLSQYGSAEDFATMSHQQIQQLMREPNLTAAQKHVIKKVRRRGRNKVAARKCRQRRVVGETDTPMPSTSNEQVQNQRFYVRPIRPTQSNVLQVRRINGNLKGQPSRVKYNDLNMP
uniref:BZIP domain-containing protein n=1 Tax=Acrobeloides nanus TaxID=290746 RepID=A0A914DRW5_9BILA